MIKHPSEAISHALCSSTLAGVYGPFSEIGKLSKDELKARLIKMVVDKGRSPEASWRSGEPAVASKVINEDGHAVKVAVHEVFEQNKGNLRMVSETAQICQEEGMARLLADLLDYDLLPAEAFAIGEEVRDAHRAYKGKPRTGKPADQRLKDAASTAKSKARAAAAKDEVLFDGLAQRLEEIDAVLATDRRELACAEVRLSWPPRNSVVVDGPAPLHWRARRAALEDEDDDELPSTIDEAEELAHVAALKAAALDAQYEAATHDALRAARALQRLPNEAASPVWGMVTPGVPESTRVHRARQRETWIRAYAKHQAFQDALPALRQNVECLRARADLLAECAQELKLAEYTRRLSELMIKEAQHRETCEQLKRAERAERDEVCGRVRMDAQRVWGSVHGTGVPPKVFNLNGMSAEDVAAHTPEVSQQLTSAEERISLARSVPAVVEGVAVGSAVSFGGPAVVTGVVV